MAKRLSITLTGIFLFLWLVGGIKTVFVIGSVMLIALIVGIGIVMIGTIIEWTSTGTLVDSNPMKWAYLQLKPKLKRIKRAIEAYKNA